MTLDESRKMASSIRSTQLAGGARVLESVSARRHQRVSWDVMMDTREVPASKLHELNVALEKAAWKAFRAELFPTDDLYPGIKDRLAHPARRNH